MQKIALEDAEIDMVVAESVTGSQGQLLLGAGTVITAKHIRIMKTWGVHSLIVEGGDDVSEEADLIPISDELLQQAQLLEKPRFCRANIEHEVMGYLLKEKVRLKAIKINRDN